MFPGIIVQINLKWYSHTQYVSNQIDKKCGILYLIRDFVPRKILINLYCSLVYPHIFDCNIICGNSCADHIKPLLTAQKRIVKTLTYKSKSFSSNILFRENKLLNINKLNFYDLCIFIFKIFMVCWMILSLEILMLYKIIILGTNIAWHCRLHVAVKLKNVLSILVRQRGIDCL